MNLVKAVIIIGAFLTFYTVAAPLDSAAMKDAATYLEQNCGLVDIHFHNSILKEIQGSYASTLFYDSIESENDTTMRVIIKDSSIETSMISGGPRRVEKTSFFCTGTYKTNGSLFYVNYSLEDSFIYITQAQGKQLNYGDYALMITFKDKNGPHTMNFIIKKVK
jgi:hypothetical protein